MKLPRFGVEEWLNVHEKEAVYDIAGVSIEALTLQELFELTGVSQEEFLPRIIKLKKLKLWFGLKAHLTLKKAV